jgi:nanoRNase/pAp phosphatase (c-di-AMP/oligoRNAs hydrolase)
MDTLSAVRLFLAESRRLLILCHSNADPDAIGSALAVLRAYPDKEVGICCDGISRPAKHLLSALDAKLPDCTFEPDAILVVDTATPEQLGACRDMLSLSENICSVDHHSSSLLSAPLMHHVAATSTAEIMWDILDRPSDPVLRKALLAGILTDTGHLRFATRVTFAAIQEILGDDIVFEEIYSLLREEIEMSQKAALMKALQRMKVVKVGDFLIVKTSIGAFESYVARTILNIGADVVLIVNEKRGQRIIARASRRAVEHGVDLSRIMCDVGLEYDGEGGGHPPAAGAKGVSDFNKASNQILDTITRIFKR